MEIFVTDKFLDEFIALENDSFKNKNISKLEVLFKINKLIVSGLRINSDINLDILKSRFDPTGNKSYKDIKGVIASIAIKSGNYKYNDMNFDFIPNYSAFYFFVKPLIESCSGTVTIDDLNILDDFYSNCTLNSLNIGEDDYSLIEGAVPPCNSMLIIDKYLFKGSKKMDRFMKYLKIFINYNLDVPFQLTIISSYESNGIPIASTVFKKYTSELNNIHNLQYQIFLDSRIPTDDRKFFTNYTKANCGHPFDRETIYNQNFLAGSEHIMRDYIDYCKEINKWKVFCSSIPNNMGPTVTRYSNTSFVNRLFEITRI